MSHKNKILTPSDLATPGIYGLNTIRGFKFPPHLALFDRAVVNAITGRGPRKIGISIPPRHGKTMYFGQATPSWYMSTFPHNNFMFASYEAGLAANWGRKSRDQLVSTQHLYGLGLDRSSKSVSTWSTSEGGTMYTMGSGGALTGKGGHMIVVDDPIKNEEEARSVLVRDNLWEWWGSTLLTRLEPQGVLVLVQTRWNEDDLMGRVRNNARDGEWLWINIPALCLDPQTDPLGREIGQAIWPERYDETALLDIKRNIGPYWWSALYEGSPTPREGGMFNSAMFEVVDRLPEFYRSIRSWDLAASDNEGNHTVGALCGITQQGDFCVGDIQRGQWGPATRDARIKATADADGNGVRIFIPQDPGAAGKMQVKYLGSILQGYMVKTDKITGDKLVNAEGLSSHGGTRKILLKKAPWNQAFINELVAFREGAAHDDQVDATSMGYNWLVGKRTKLIVI